MTQLPTTRKILGAITVAGAAMTSAAPAYAQWDHPGEHRHSVEIELHFDADPGFNPNYPIGYGFGGRVNIPILANGFIPSVNNSVAIGVGADFTYVNTTPYTSVRLAFPVVLQWNFHVDPAWTLFFEPGVYTSLLFATEHGCVATAPTIGVAASVPGQCQNPYFMVEAAVGAKWHFAGPQRYPAVVFRVGWPSGLSLGISL